MIAYLLGAVPFGLLFARLKGIDIRKVGSGNIGATNVFRSVSKGLGIFTFFCDMLKGFVASKILPVFMARITGNESSQMTVIIFALLAVAGHNWPVYLKFKGGKGIATTAGALIGIAPSALGIGFLSWIIIFLSSRYVSVASIMAAIVVSIAGWLFRAEGDLTTPVFLTVLAALGIWRHKTNIQRLIKGTEHRFEFGKKKKIS